LYIFVTKLHTFLQCRVVVASELQAQL